jgi:hypothetical protein
VTKAIPATDRIKPEPPKLKILVSSAVFGYEDFLESIYALLNGYGYEVLMSYKGTLPVDPTVSAMDACLKSVERCDLFLGLILPRYGSGIEAADGLSITHREILYAIKINKPRWFLVHEHVTIARELLKPYRISKAKFPITKDTFEATPILSDLKVLDMYEAAIQQDVKPVKNRTGNWAQPFGPDDDARLFVTAQFRRYQELADRFLPKLKEFPKQPTEGNL